MQDTKIKVRALIKAQSALTRIELRAKGTQAVYGALALVFALFALGMVNVGVFLGLSPHVGGAWAAMILAGGNALLAVAIGKAASGVTPGPEGETAKELRDMVVDVLSEDAERLTARLQGIGDNIDRARKGLASVASGGGLIPGLSSIVSLLTSALRKGKS